eukprot:1219198-Rhodomonas_salina.1
MSSHARDLPDGGDGTQSKRPKYSDGNLEVKCSDGSLRVSADDVAVYQDCFPQGSEAVPTAFVQQMMETKKEMIKTKKEMMKVIEEKERLLAQAVKPEKQVITSGSLGVPPSVKKDWDAPYCGSISGLVQILEYQLQCSTCYSMAYLCQSSGYGKSRALRELAKVKKLIYVCLRGSNETGFPPRTSQAEDLLTASHSTQVTSWLRRVASFYDVFASDSPDTAWERQDVVNGGKAMQQAWKDCTESENAGGEQVLVVLDEAQYLINKEIDGGESSLFRCLRRCMATSQDGVLGRIFIVLVSTSSRVSNFWPSLEYSSASDRSGGDRHQLIIALETIDARSDTTNREDIRGYGRPLWSAYDPEAAFTIAAHKLMLAPKSSTLAVAQIRQAQQAGSLGLLAIAIVRLALHVRPTHTDAQKLVSSHLATLLGLSENRESVAVAYPAEPVVAEAAARLWNGWYNEQPHGTKRTPEHSAPTILEVVAEHVGSFLVATGELGEIVGKLLWLHAADQCARENPDQWMYWGPFQLSDFAKAVVGGSLDLQGNWEGTMRVSAFVQLSQSAFEEAPQSLLERMYLRGVAGVMPPGHKGADLMAPVKLKCASGYGILLGQTKNHDETRGIRSDSIAGAALRPASVFSGSRAMADWSQLPSWGVHMEVGAPGANASEVAIPQRNPVRVCKSIDFKPPTIVCEGVPLPEWMTSSVENIHSATLKLSRFTGHALWGDGKRWRHDLPSLI